MTQGAGPKRSSGSMRLGSTSGNTTQGSGQRRSSGSMRPGSAPGITGRMTGSRGLRLKPVIEVITVSSSSESEAETADWDGGEEDIEILEENLKRLASRKTGRKYVETNKRVHSNKGRHQTQDVTCVRPRVTFTTL